MAARTEGSIHRLTVERHALAFVLPDCGDGIVLDREIRRVQSEQNRDHGVETVSAESIGEHGRAR